MLDKIKSYLQQEAEAILAIDVNDSTLKAADFIAGCKGKVFTTGIGKAGYVARKAASTFSTTGSASVFLHPGDASHGDVGVVGEHDILVAYSNSGKTREVLETVYFAKALGISSVISITATNDSPLAEASELVLEIGNIQEACPHGLTPTASTAAMFAISDALALAAMELRGFSEKDFARRHHGGYLGETLKKAGHI